MQHILWVVVEPFPFNLTSTHCPRRDDPVHRGDQGSRLAFMLTYILTADFNLDRSLH